MKKILGLSVAAAIALASTTALAATTFGGTDTVSPKPTDLDVSYVDGGNFSFDLADGASTGPITLFDLYTTGSPSHTTGAIDVNFDFTTPSPGATGGVDGSITEDTIKFLGYTIGHDNQLTWDDNGITDISINNGSDTYDLQVKLLGATFNYGFFDFYRFGDCWGTPVKAVFTLESVTPDLPAGGVPEPASWLLMLAGVGGVGAALRVRRSSQGLPA